MLTPAHSGSWLSWVITPLKHNARELAVQSVGLVLRPGDIPAEIVEEEFGELLVMVRENLVDCLNLCIVEAVLHIWTVGRLAIDVKSLTFFQRLRGSPEGAPVATTVA